MHGGTNSQTNKTTEAFVLIIESSSFEHLVLVFVSRECVRDWKARFSSCGTFFQFFLWSPTMLAGS